MTNDGRESKIERRKYVNRRRGHHEFPTVYRWRTENGRLVNFRLIFKSHGATEFGIRLKKTPTDDGLPIYIYISSFVIIIAAALSFRSPTTIAVSRIFARPKPFVPDEFSRDDRHGVPLPPDLGNWRVPSLERNYRRGARVCFPNGV